ncbi:hypothetical protein RHS02_02424, partial [Rhizoctonia solani]
MPRTTLPIRALSKRAPTCAAGAPTWWNNAQGATPCEVYQSIMDVCGYTVPSISNSDSYYPVTLAQLCMCNTVAYNLGSACQDCQRGSTDQGILFSTYVTGGDGCVAPITSLPDSVNPVQQIPEWALIDTSTTFWSYNIAQSVANSGSTTTSSESATTTLSPSTTIMDGSPTITLSDPTGSAPSSTAAPPPSTSKSTNAGAIGGGVAGGVVFLLLVIGLLLFLRRHRAQKSHSNANAVVGAIGGRNGSTSSESSLTESGKAPGSSSHYTPHSQMAQLNHSGGSGSINPSHSTSALNTPVDAPPVPPIAHEYAASSTAYSRSHDHTSVAPSRSHATSPTPSAPAVQKVKRVPVRYSEDEIARADEEDKRANALSSSPPR